MGLPPRAGDPGVVTISLDDRAIAISTPLKVPMFLGEVRAILVVVANRTSRDAEVLINGRPMNVTRSAAAVREFKIGSDAPVLQVQSNGRQAARPLFNIVPATELRVESEDISRWSVSDRFGTGWFPQGALHKWDVQGRPFFHADKATLTVPQTTLRVSVTRGIEYARESRVVRTRSGRLTSVRLARAACMTPRRPAGTEQILHVHLNYSGDYIATPSDAAKMQMGEELHLMNLVAGNWLTSRVYDREAFEAWKGRDLPWSSRGLIARWGVEYRNDLLGHFHALGLGSVPDRYQTGHARSDQPFDWPPNAVACEEFRAAGATIGYTHPVAEPLADGDIDGVFGNPHSCDARELVADAALGLVDSIDLLGPSNSESATYLYHKLLNCGIRLTASVGTDIFISHARNGTTSNPPGWARVYAFLAGQPLTVSNWQRAFRAGHTVVTNGPWLELTVDGHGPGDVLDLPIGHGATVESRCLGPGVERLSIIGPHGPYASSPIDGPTGELTCTVPILGPTWIAAMAEGAQSVDVLDYSVLAHSTPVHIECDGQRFSNAADARWCLQWLDRLESFSVRYGTFGDSQQREDLRSVIDRARTYYRALVASPI